MSRSPGPQSEALIANYRLTGDYVEAKRLFERALYIKELAFGPDHPSVANSLGNQALVLEAMGSYAEAQPMFERTLAIKQAALGPEHPEVASCLNNLAENHKRMGDYRASRWARSTPGARRNSSRAESIARRKTCHLAAACQLR